MTNKIELSSSKIKFEDLLSLVDKAIDTGIDIQIRRRIFSQNNTTMKFLKWVEKHKIISLFPIEIEAPPKRVSIRSRKRKIEIALQLVSLNVHMKEISRIFNVKIATAQSYFKDLENYTVDYLHILRLVLKMKEINSETNIADFPSFPIRINIKSLREELPKDEFEQLISISEHNKYLKRITGQKLGTTDLSILLPEKSKQKKILN